MTSQRVASRYAKSLVDLARERQELDAVRADVDDLLAMTKQRELALLLNSPVVNPSKKQSILSALMDKAGTGQLMRKFVGIVVQKGREMDLPAILRDFIRQYKDINNISTVKLTSARPFTEENLAALRARLISSGMTQAEVDIQTAVDPDLLGGFVLEMDGKVYDASAAHKLKQLRAELAAPNAFKNQLAAG